MKITCEKTALAVNPAVIENKADDLCSVDWVKTLFDEARRASCGKCTFCREGTQQIYKIIEDITNGEGESEDIALLTELAQMIRGNSSCEIARDATGHLLTVLEKYEDEWDMHIKRKRCPAVVCKAYISVHILPDKCQGCTACITACPEKAIVGGDGLIHVIDQEKCTRCGECFAPCKYDGIVKAGAVKPKTPETPVPVGTFESGGNRRRRRG
ncbi:MAG: hypothetical protein H6Q73_3906 [Firmicutes bacterium]|nr:hypothetical protein [Bacillota bacterium]